MLTQFDALALLAQSRIQSMNQGFRAQNSANLGTAMLMLGGIALAGVLGALIAGLLGGGAWGALFLAVIFCSVKNAG